MTVAEDPANHFGQLCTAGGRVVDFHLAIAHVLHVDLNTKDSRICCKGRSLGPVLGEHPTKKLQDRLDCVVHRISFRFAGKGNDVIKIIRIDHQKQ